MTRTIEQAQRVAKLTVKRPDRLNHLLVCESVVEPVEEHLRETGRHLCEEAAFLAGYVSDGAVGIVTTAVLPYTRSSAAFCTLPIDVTASCLKTIREMGQIVLAQIHTHGQRSFHSCTDDDWAVCDSPGFISIVVPSYGRFGLGRMFNGGAAIHELMCNHEWRKLPSEEVRRRFRVIPSNLAVV